MVRDMTKSPLKALARLGVCAKLFHVSRTGFDVYGLEHHRLAVIGPYGL